MKRTIKTICHITLCYKFVFVTSLTLWHSITYTRNSYSKEACFMWHGQEEDGISWEYVLFSCTWHTSCILRAGWLLNTLEKDKNVVYHFALLLNKS